MARRRKRTQNRGTGAEKRSSGEAYEESVAAPAPQTEPPRTRRRGETLIVVSLLVIGAAFTINHRKRVGRENSASQRGKCHIDVNAADVWDMPADCPIVTKGEWLEYPKASSTELGALIADALAKGENFWQVVENCGDASKYAVLPNITPTTVGDLKALFFGNYEPQCDHFGQTLNEASRCIAFALNHIWDLENVINPGSLSVGELETIRSKLGWVDKWPIALDVGQAQGPSASRVSLKDQFVLMSGGGERGTQLCGNQISLTHYFIFGQVKNARRLYKKPGTTIWSHC
jgi:hypothetical protein